MSVVGCRFVAVGVLVAALGAGCGSPSGSVEKGIPADTAAGLAARAERVAAALDAGSCDQARSEALSLQADVTALKLAPKAQAEASGRAARLVAAINCPPPPTTTTPPAVVVGDIQREKGKKHKGGHGHDD